MKEDEIDSLLVQNDNLMLALDMSLSLGNFYVEQLGNSIQTKMDLISELTDSIQGTAIYEVNEEQMNGVESYLENNPDDDSLTIKDVMLGNIAFQCPLTGGAAVFKARAYYKLLHPDAYYDDSWTCIQSGVVYRNKPSVSIDYCTLFPNPTTGKFQLDYSISSDAILEIIDGTGRVVLNSKISSEKSNESIDLSSYQNGLYYCRIINDNGVIFQKKVVVAK